MVDECINIEVAIRNDDYTENKQCFYYVKPPDFGYPNPSYSVQ